MSKNQNTRVHLLSLHEHAKCSEIETWKLKPEDPAARTTLSKQLAAQNYITAEFQLPRRVQIAASRARSRLASFWTL